MQLRWTSEAAADLERIADYLFQHVPERAAELVRAVYDAPALLLAKGRAIRCLGIGNQYGVTQDPFGSPQPIFP